jgi:ubiquinone/menaquinone biosynthesis C-methylase UbiE
MTNDLHEANRRQWNAASGWWQRRTDERGVWKKCHQDPSLVLTPTELSFLKNVHGKSACVLGSGDNEVVFALAGMGANVASVDISEKQLERAEKRAEILGLAVNFLRADISDLAELEENRFDYVYTGGHISVWLSDIRKYYSEAVRILKPDGLFIVNDYHPFRRIWKDGSKQFVIDQPYFSRGPFEYQSEKGFPTIAVQNKSILDKRC